MQLSTKKIKKPFKKILHFKQVQDFVSGSIWSYLRVHSVHRLWVRHTYVALNLWKQQEGSKGKAVLRKFARFHKL